MEPTSPATTDQVLDRLRVALAGRRRPLVVGGYGCGNVGDEAILSVLIDDLRRLDVAPRVLSARPAQTARMHDVTADAATPHGLLRALAATDALVIGGGGIFSAYMGPRSRNLPSLARLARLLRRPVIFRALGVYATTPPAVARTLVRSMERADFVSVRDEASVRALRAFGLQRALILEDDPALRLPVAPHARSRPPGHIGVAVRRLRAGALQPRLAAELVALLDQLTSTGLTPVLLPFSAHPDEPVEQDDAYARELRARCARPEGVIIEEHLNPHDMLRAVQSLDAIVAMRFHAIVFATSARTPAVALPYDDKCRVFIQHHAPGTAVAEIETVTAASLFEALPLAALQEVA
ncbi:MAG TPA: polysaccharide pyruvyl transferase family protein [Dehalococcoidia bacterium]|nr:polysaccharide pyruvyl transferase family protein [Dehalococcoidia bacterium]